MGQGNLSPVEDCPRGQGNLVPTACTLSPSPTDQFVSLPVSASRANETIGPPTGGQILLAGFFSGERLETGAAFWETAAEARVYATDCVLLNQPDKQKASTVDFAAPRG